MSTAGPIAKLQRSFAYRVSKWFPSEMLRWMDQVSDLIDSVIIVGGGAVVKDYATLRLVGATLVALGFTSIRVASRATQNDDGGGIFNFVSGSVAVDNDATILVSGTDRFFRQYDGPISPLWWGASPSATAAVNGAKIQAAIDFLTALGGGEIQFPRGYFLSTALILKSGVYLVGEGPGVGFNVGADTTIEVAGAAAAITTTNTTFCGIRNMSVFQSGTGDCIVFAQTGASNNQFGEVSGCELVFNGTAAAGIHVACSGTGNVYFLRSEDNFIHGIPNSAGNAAWRTTASSTGGAIRPLWIGGRYYNVERAFDLKNTVGGMAFGVSCDGCITPGGTGRYIYAAADTIANRFIAMGLEVFPAADKAAEFLNASPAVADNFIVAYLQAAPSTWIVDNGVRNGWEGGDASGTGNGLRDKSPYPTDHTVGITRAKRTATTTPVTITQSDFTVLTNLAAPGPVAVNLPAAASCNDGLEIIIKDGLGDATVNHVTVNAGSGTSIDGAASAVINVNRGVLWLIYDKSSTTWEIMLS